MSHCDVKPKCCPAPCSFECYCQPPRAKICRPSASLALPKEGFEKCTIYKKSFCPPGCAKRQPIRKEDNLKLTYCKMDGNTVHKLSFPYLPCSKPPCPILPCNRNIIGDGPMSCVTTHRHDYVPKPIPRVSRIVPPTNLRCSEQPFECTTIMNASYVPVYTERQPSFKPVAVYYKPTLPFRNETVQKLSYIPWPPQRKEHYPWSCKGSYVCPSVPMECDTIASSSYQCNAGIPRRSLIYPPKNDTFNLEKKCMDICTIYRKSFCPPGCAKRQPIRKEDNLKLTYCKMDGNTVHKLSFPYVPCAKPCPILPCNRNIIGDGPLSCVTTHRHDYVPKPIPRVSRIVPPTNLRCSEQPLECTTVTNTSYIPVYTERRRSYKPVAVYNKPTLPFRNETVQKLSYIPWPPQRKEHYPWSCKGSYVCPSIPLETTSIYKASFPAPGTFNHARCAQSFAEPNAVACKADFSNACCPTC